MQTRCRAGVIIPRPGPQGHVVLGGTYIPQNYSTLPDLKTAERILQDCYNLLPELAGPNGTAGKIRGCRATMSASDLLAKVCRIELEKKMLKGAALNPGKRDDGRKAVMSPSSTPTALAERVSKVTAQLAYLTPFRYQQSSEPQNRFSS